ncbi:hypothetical protein QZH41_016442, partial [Actinostola sp. cb2023]
TTLAWDNIDRLEETLSGEGTSHRVNGIAVQANHFGPQLQSASTPTIMKSKRRSIESVGDATLPIYNAGKVATPDVEHGLLRAKGIGEEAYEAFREQRLESNPPKVKFHDTITKAKLKTFTHQNKKITVKAGATSDRVDVVFDDYRDESIKNAERENRGEGSGGEYRNIQADHKTRVKYIDVSRVVESVGPNVCRSLPGLHAFTGCDTVSAFAGRGKVAAYRIVTRSAEFQETFQQLGMEWNLSDDLYRSLQKFTCTMYCRNPGTSDVNELRYRLFCLKRGDVDSNQLPPCNDTLCKHSLRANYQAAVWRRSLQRCPEIPSPVGSGWCTEDDKLVVDWMGVQPAPKAVLQLLSCQCSRSCKLPSCSCLVNGLRCTDMCRLQDCTNRHGEDDDVVSDDDDNDEDSA